MKKEIKISLPPYKITYSICFVVILSLIRGVVYTNEVGLALEPPVAILSAVFCADTYTQEITGKRSEVWRLYPLKSQMRSLYTRTAIQEICLLLLSAVGYVLFFLFQKPASLYKGYAEKLSMTGFLHCIQENSESEIKLFLTFLPAILVTIHFWGILSLVLSCLLRNMWAGIGCSFLLWIVTDSTVGEKYFGKWNLFSYTFRDIQNDADFSWICGKIVCIMISILLIIILPWIIREMRFKAARSR